jgi:outer membrane lipoprotein-sorting protein
MNRTPPPNSREDQQLRDLLNETLPAGAPSPALSERIAAMAAESDAKRHFEAAAPNSTPIPKKRSFAPRFRLALSAATVMFILAGAALVTPRIMTTQALARVEAAMAKVTNSHMVNYLIQDGKRVKTIEAWSQNGQWRIENESQGHIRIYKGGRSWNYDPVQNTVTVKSSPEGPFAHTPTGFTLSALLHDMVSTGGKTRVLGRSNETIDGKEVQRVEVELVTDYETTKLTLLVDPETNLPSHIDWTARTRYGKKDSGAIDLSFNQPLDASLFQPKFKRAPRYIDMAREQLQKQKNLEKVIASQKIGERTLTINDLQVNARGAVFLLYTAGKKIGDQFGDGANRFAGRDWKITLTDSLGTRYQWIDAGDFTMEQGAKETANGTRLEGDWWVPEEAPERGQRWRSRTFKLRFELNPKNLHGHSINNNFPADYSAQAQFQVPVSSPTDGLVPE